MNTWDLTYFYDSDKEFLADLESLKSYLPRLKGYCGKLNDEQSFKEYLLLSKELESKLYKVYQYSSLKSDLNKKNVENAMNANKVRMFIGLLSQETAFQSPEILSIGKDKVMQFIDNNKELEEFRFGMEKLFRMNKHVLSNKEETLLSYYDNLNESGARLYSNLSTADSKEKKVKLSDGKYYVVTQGNWRGMIAELTNPKDRKKVFEAIFNQYADYKNTYADIYNTVMQAELASCKARNYKSILESHLYENNIPVEVFKNLVNIASTKNESLKKYYALRREYLGLKNHYSYDRFLQLAHSNKKYSYDEAKNIFFASIASCPEDFKEKAHEVLKEGFVDVYEQDGKRSGAYSSSMPDMHPFILLNYTDTLDDVFTVAHEAGHSIHSMYSASAQPAALQGYTIFVAEIASTFNEHMLLDYFIKSGNATRDEKIMLLQKAIDEICGTFYRQTLFAHYEYEVSKLIEKNEPINYEILSNIMIKLYKKYYGLNIKKEHVKQYVWAYIPHLFYTPFYVYQYATSFAASFALYSNVKQNKENAFENYTNLLKSGGSKFPVDQARDAGVDFTKKETFMAVVNRMDELVNELEKLLKEKEA